MKLLLFVLPRNMDIVLWPWTKVDELACDCYTGNRTRLLPTADGKLLVFMPVKETLSQSSTRQLSCGMRGGPHQTAVTFSCDRRLHLYRYAGYCTRLFWDATWDPLITEAFEKDTLYNPRSTQAACTNEEVRHREVAQGAIETRGYKGSIRHPPEVILLRNAMEDLPLEAEHQSLAAFTARGDVDAVHNGGTEEHWRPPCTAPSGQVCQVNGCLPIYNEPDIGLQLRQQQCETSLSLRKVVAGEYVRSGAAQNPRLHNQLVPSG
ncbi:hypothetical protein HPB50_027838 [Hyalomma asiaticum]|nr:hypothetical protein HPB50_027838 [Hyalomma asiaticum]